MTPVGMEPAKLTPAQQVKPQANQSEPNNGSAPLKVEQNKVTLSDEGKALLAALQEIDKYYKRFGEMPLTSFDSPASVKRQTTDYSPPPVDPSPTVRSRQM